MGVAAWISGSPSRGQEKPSVEGEVRFRADKAEADEKRGAVVLEGGVVVTYDRFRLTSERLVIERKTSAVEMRGAAKVALCPCEDPPVSVGISRARATGQGELVLRWPRLYVGPVPVFVLPWLWLRPADRVGLLPPRIALRGADGALIGAGARLPWRGADGPRVIELQAAGYVQGGVELGARIEAPTATGKILWDRLRRDRFVVDTHGFVRTDARPDVKLAWDLDTIRGARGLVATPLLAQAAQPFDTGAAEVSMRVAPGRGVGAIVGTGLAARARRGEGPIVWGPTAFVGAGGAAGRRGSWEANASLGMLSGGEDKGATPYARAEAGIEVAPRLGPVATRARLGTRARLAGPEGDPMSWDVVAEARAEARLSLERVFVAAEGEAPLVHRVAPLIEARVAIAEGAGAFFQTIRPTLGPMLGLVALGVSSSLGRAFGSSIEAEARGGILATRVGTSALGWASVEGTQGLVSARIEAVASAGSVDLASKENAGVGAAAEVRMGAAAGPSVVLDVYGRSAGTGALARSLGGGGFLLGDGIGVVREQGITVGAGASAPLSRAIAATGRADVDPRTGTLVGARGTLGYRHFAGCAEVLLGSSYRAGRPGVDVWLVVDLVPPLSPSPSSR